MNGIVYLAGGIAGLVGDEAVSWRVEAANRLHWNYDIKTRNPMRGKSRLWGATTISSNFHDYEKHGPAYSSKAIMTRDFNDVKQCDALLVNLLGATKPSIGSVMELAWAYALQKPTVVVMEAEGNPHDNHPMIHESMGFRVTTLEEGINAVAVILGA